MDEADRVRLRGVWVGMLARCNNPKHRAFPWYGAKGVRVRFQGLRDFTDWAQRSGYRPGLWIDRIDNDGDYSAGNCRWITPKEQLRRRASNRMVSAFGGMLCLAAWADDPRCVVSYDTLKQRLDAGWQPERAITEVTVPPAARDHCLRGHLFDEANTIIQATGARRCRQCFNDKRRARRARIRASGGRPA